MEAATPGSVPFVRVMRGGLLESLHRGHLVAVGPDGTEITHLGDPDFPTFLRSAAKPLQAVPVVESGAAAHYALSESELALMCGSVSGQDYHVAAVRSILAKIGADESLLACGVHRPSHRPTARRMAEAGESYLPVHNNCAGKHAAMLVLCAYHGWDPAGYIAVDHPVQALIRQTVADLCGVAPDSLGVGIDGCGVPVFQAPLNCLARAYARLAAPARDPGLSASRITAVQRITAACREHPEMVAGDDRVCTEAMRAGGGAFLAKTGAEGSYGIALCDRGIGVAFKIEDGSQRAIGPTVVEILSQTGALHQEALSQLRRFHHVPVNNHRKETVGELQAVLDLGGALSP